MGPYSCASSPRQRVLGHVHPPLSSGSSTHAHTAPASPCAPLTPTTTGAPPVAVCLPLCSASAFVSALRGGQRQAFPPPEQTDWLHGVVAINQQRMHASAFGVASPLVYYCLCMDPFPCSNPNTPLMERILRKYDKECMKMMMLKHEETFRQQVGSLHLQQLNHKRARDSFLPSTSRLRRRCRVLDLELPADEYIERGEADAMVEVEQEGDIELALTIGSGWRKREETCEDSGASFSSSSTGSGELKPSGHGWELQQVEGVSFSYGDGFELEALRASRLKQPPWHLQCLSLRMT
ncbi:hypothetical protein BHM03_00005994 [Ensete ventricosum]|uniref:Uncharacterized protein n=1 Tax=Ensete ventricosum TaxID=4639 RepID=A0A445MBF0_ENSVE|nr:hypothetical protein BHM03_00005994 [Ensete ventricosum]